MKTFINAGVAATLVNISLTSLTHHSPINQLKPKRALLTCLETYGGGSITCGNDDSLYCYDPTLGETCCELDNGYCKAGDSCAPTAGYCCTVGEDPETCAARLDFTLPSSFSIAAATSPIPSTIPTTSAPLTTASTSTIRISLALAIAAEPTIQAAALTVDTEGMTPQYSAPVGNNTTDSAAARTATSNLAAFTGAASAKSMSEMGGVLGLAVALVGYVL